MSGSGHADELTRRFPFAKVPAARPPVPSTLPASDDAASEGGGEGACPAFGYLRGRNDRALAVEFRFRDGNVDALPYGHLAGWRFDPSAGLLLKFTADVITLVLIRGSNLDAPATPGGVNLLDGGLQRHRILWVREMDAATLKAVGDAGPTVDRIEVGEFESHADLREWLGRAAPAFLR